ncbi:hypothetical protein ACTWP5_19025 [Streptomyces sp. 4N509B]|uniref:hypothetical protein n=1 Tax=Streptomyces sp. 4N509B TaxID=3457413 RepID=UPI003FCF9F29
MAALLAGALTGCSLGGEQEPERDPAASDPLPAASPAPSVEAPRVPSAPELPGRVLGLDFADEEHGFALLAECRQTLPRGAGRDCAFGVAVLDGDGAWRLREAPMGDGDLDEFGFLVEAASPGHARLSAQGDPYDLGDDAVWVTRDAGRSWTSGEARPEGTVAAIPDGARLSLTTDGLVALMPETAAYRLLREQPRLTDLGEPRPLGDGRHWVAGRDPETGDPALAVSRASGRGWRTLAPLPTAPPFRNLVRHRDVWLAAGPDGLYALENGLSDEPDGGTSSLYGDSLLGIHVSEDDGRSWRRVWRHLDGDSRPGALLGTPMTATDGSLRVYGYDAIYVSRDGGYTFAVERPGPPPEEPLLTRAGYLLTDLTNPGHYRLSADGFTWHTVVLGGG